MTGLARLEFDGAVAVIRLDRPPVNAINSQMSADLLQAAAAVVDNPAVRAVLLYGGPKVFAGGGDIAEMAELHPGEVSALLGSLGDALNAIARLPVPVIAAVTGYALGGGLELALAADLRVVADTAVLGFPEILLGVIPGAGGTQRLPRLIGAGRAKEMIFTGRRIGGSEAVEIGLATHAVPAASVYDEAMTLARALAAGPTAALAAAKRAIDDGMDGSLEAGLHLEGERFAELFATEDQTIGMTSFLRNGPGKAVFVGR
jgi:enoyl-CoA hydratase/carnithine racemase